jgi:phosphoribosylformimino-5-aminoimidazole carboxamide ribotide isomerase
MLIYPVMDLKGGLVVRGAGGDRARYRGIESCLVSSADPIQVAHAFREGLGIGRVYVADLDALGGAPPARDVLEALSADGFHLLVDTGVRSLEDAGELLRIGVSEAIAPLETLPDPRVLEHIIATLGAERIVFSLDLKGGAHLGHPSGWPHPDAESLAHEAYRCGARRILLLDLAHVGSRGGPAYLNLLSKLAAQLPDVDFLSGGGVRSREDLALLAETKVRGVLMASALHDGVVTRSVLEDIQRSAATS